MVAQLPYQHGKVDRETTFSAAMRSLLPAALAEQHAATIETLDHRTRKLSKKAAENKRRALEDAAKRAANKRKKLAAAEEKKSAATAKKVKTTDEDETIVIE